MFEFIAILLTGAVLLLLVTVVWAHHKLSGQQVFKGGSRRREQGVKAPGRSGQLGFIGWFSAGVKNVNTVKRVRNPAKIKTPWGW